MQSIVIFLPLSPKTFSPKSVYELAPLTLDEVSKSYSIVTPFKPMTTTNRRMPPKIPHYCKVFGIVKYDMPKKSFTEIMKS